MLGLVKKIASLGKAAKERIARLCSTFIPSRFLVFLGYYISLFRKKRRR